MIAAHGKVILLGEHAVVHGRPALVLPLKNAMRVREWTPDRQRVRLSVPAWGLVVDEPLSLRVSTSTASVTIAAPVPDDYAHKALSQAVRKLIDTERAAGAMAMGFDAVADTNLPVGAGLGASAALSVLLVRLSAAARNEEVPERVIRERAHMMEEVFHGNPSGIDDTAATYDGPIVFSRNGFHPPPTLPVAATQLIPQALRLDLPLPRLCIAASGIPKHTRVMVARVAAFAAASPVGAAAIFDEIAALVMRGIDALARRDMADLGVCMNRNHELLVELGLGHPELERMREMALAAGALGAKLTGAGGGGAVIALLPEAPMEPDDDSVGPPPVSTLVGRAARGGRGVRAGGGGYGGHADASLGFSFAFSHSPDLPPCPVADAWRAAGYHPRRYP